MKLTTLFLTAALAAVPLSALAQSGTQNTDSTEAAVQAKLQSMEARYRASIALAPEVASYHVGLAEVLARRGRVDEAAAEYAEAVRLDPLSSRNRAMLGQFLLQRGDVTGAVEQMRAAVERDPTNPAFREVLADAYGRQNKWDDAAAALAQAVNLSPADSQYRRALRAAREQAGVEVDAPIVSSGESAGPPIILRLIELTMGAVLAIAGVALVYPIISGIFLAGRTGIAMLATGRT